MNETRKIKICGFCFFFLPIRMVKNSNLKMGIVPKLKPKKSPDISHLTGIYPKLEAHGSPTLDELFPDRKLITEFEVKHKDGNFDIVYVYDLPKGLAWKWIKNKFPDSEIEFIALIHPDQF